MSGEHLQSTEPRLGGSAGVGLWLGPVNTVHGTARLGFISVAMIKQSDEKQQREEGFIYHTALLLQAGKVGT